MSKLLREVQGAPMGADLRLEMLSPRLAPGSIKGEDGQETEGRRKQLPSVYKASIAGNPVTISIGTLAVQLLNPDMTLLKSLPYNAIVTCMKEVKDVPVSKKKERKPSYSLQEIYADHLTYSVTLTTGKGKKNRVEVVMDNDMQATHLTAAIKLASRNLHERTISSPKATVVARTKASVGEEQWGSMAEKQRVHAIKTMYAADCVDTHGQQIEYVSVDCRDPTSVGDEEESFEGALVRRLTHGAKAIPAAIGAGAIAGAKKTGELTVAGAKMGASAVVDTTKKVGYTGNVLVTGVGISAAARTVVKPVGMMKEVIHNVHTGQQNRSSTAALTEHIAAERTANMRAKHAEDLASLQHTSLTRELAEVKAEIALLTPRSRAKAELKTAKKFTKLGLLQYPESIVEQE